MVDLIIVVLLLLAVITGNWFWTMLAFIGFLVALKRHAELRNILFIVLGLMALAIWHGLMPV